MKSLLTHWIFLFLELFLEIKSKYLSLLKCLTRDGYFLLILIALYSFSWIFYSTYKRLVILIDYNRGLTLIL